MVFDAGIKKTCRHNQYFGVRAAQEAVKRREGGIIWHTQGSGKSLTMLWLCLKLRRQKELHNPTLLIVSDRKDLDRQISETFLNCGFGNPIRALRVRSSSKKAKGSSRKRN